MLDAAARPWLDRSLAPAARHLARCGITADQITVVGFALGMGSAVAVAFGSFTLGLALTLLNRLFDGLDGAVARATRLTDRGGFLDIALDFIFYAAVPLAFAVHDPTRNGLAAAALIASFLANGGAFLAYATIAANRGLKTVTQGRKSIYYLAGLAEGTETIIALCAFCLWPAAFPWLAGAFAALCAVSAMGRLIVGWRTLA